MKKISLLISAIALLLCSCGNRGNQGSLVSFSGSADTTTVVFDNFEEGNGLRVINLNHKRYIQLTDGTAEATIDEYLSDKSAMFDATLYFVDEPSGNSVIDLSVNSSIAATILLNGKERKLCDTTIAGIDIARGSRISLNIKSDNGEKCRIEKLVLKPVGKYEGKGRPGKPGSLEIFSTTADKARARKIFADFVRTSSDSAENQRVAELKRL